MKSIALPRARSAWLGTAPCRPCVVEFVGLLLDAHDLLGQRVEPLGVLADRAQQRHRLQHEFGRLRR